MVTLDEVRAYLHEDADDAQTTALLGRLILTADAYLTGAIGVNYDDTDERAKQLALLVISDLYDNRSTQGAKVGGTVRQMVSDFMLQLRVEGVSYASGGTQ